MSESTAGVRDILVAILEGWDNLRVRVKQGGKMRFMPLEQVQDQKLVLKIVLEAIKQAAKENGIA